MNKSPGIAASSFAGIEFLNGVVRLYDGIAPSSFNFFANLVIMKDALSTPSSLMTLLIASNHLLVSIGSKSFDKSYYLIKIYI